MGSKGYDFELIPRKLGYESPEKTPEHNEPYKTRIDEAYKNLWKSVKLPNFT